MLTGGGIGGAHGVMSAVNVSKDPFSKATAIDAAKRGLTGAGTGALAGGAIVGLGI
ncbi:hypothetical protein AGMMS49950_10220 [Endomicrobiia bacterium]|nr:hypothetical protein AGMMS49950_10220 [Endomicrobiia bacterium]